MTSRYFHVSEFDCHDGVPYPEAWTGDRLAALMSQLDIIRAEWGGPIRIVSGYRTASWNGKVAGASGSQHVEGRAADIAPMVKGTVLHAATADLHGRIMRLLGQQQLPLIGGVGNYPGKWVHVDVRAKPGGHLAQWQGTGVGSEPIG